MRFKKPVEYVIAGALLMPLAGCKSPDRKPKYEECTPPEAKRLLDSAQDYVYLDVRTQAEFEAGHVPGALNVPVLERSGEGGMTPNDDFLRVVQTNLARDTPLLVGCRSGRRSAMAVRKMRDAGYIHVTNVQGGYSGRKDESGEVVVPGWSLLGYPIEIGDGGPRSYHSLKAIADE